MSDKRYDGRTRLGAERNAVLSWAKAVSNRLRQLDPSYTQRVDEKAFDALIDAAIAEGTQKRTLAVIAQYRRLVGESSNMPPATIAAIQSVLDNVANAVEISHMLSDATGQV